MVDLHLKDKVAIVTGAGSGITVDAGYKKPLGCFTHIDAFERQFNVTSKFQSRNLFAFSCPYVCYRKRYSFVFD